MDVMDRRRERGPDNNPSCFLRRFDQRERELLLRHFFISSWERRLGFCDERIYLLPGTRKRYQPFTTGHTKTAAETPDLPFALLFWFSSSFLTVISASSYLPAPHFHLIFLGALDGR
jgi:hypothetical protein